MTVKTWRFVRKIALPGEHTLMLTRTGPKQFAARVKDGALYVGQADD